MQGDLALRYPDMDALIAALEPFAGTAMVPLARRALAPPSHVLWLAGVMAAVSVGFVALWMSSTDRRVQAAPPRITTEVVEPRDSAEGAALAAEVPADAIAPRPVISPAETKAVAHREPSKASPAPRARARSRYEGTSPAPRFEPTADPSPAEPIVELVREDF
jgi:hypothetical protein